MRKSDYTTAHEKLCELNKHSLQDLELIAMLDEWVCRLEERLDNLLDPEERENFWAEDI